LKKNIPNPENQEGAIMKKRAVHQVEMIKHKNLISRWSNEKSRFSQKKQTSIY